jgi:hypothetical protein
MQVDDRSMGMWLPDPAPVQEQRGGLWMWLIAALVMVAFAVLGLVVVRDGSVSVLLR